MAKLDGPGDQRTAQLAERPLLCVKTLLHLVVHINKDQPVQYIAAMIDDLLKEDHKYAQLFHDVGRSNNQPVYGTFITLMRRPDKFTTNQSALIIARLAYRSKEHMDSGDRAFYLSWLTEQLKTPKNEYRETVTYCLQLILRVAIYRETFVEKDGINSVINVLMGKVGFQLQYQLIFCLWVITFDPKLANRVTKCNIIPTLTDILNESVKEKVTRIVLATFRNLLEKPTELELKRENALAMVLGKVMKHLEVLEGKKFEDSDLTDDMQFLKETLEVNVRDVSSLEVYATELKSGRLEWSVVHTSAKFWLENATLLNEKNYELLKVLVGLLGNGHDALTLAVALHDVGEYVRHYPRGKTVIEQLGGKKHVMTCLTHQDPNVRYQALITLQKIMVHNWEYLGKQIEAPNANAKETTASVKM